MRQAHSLMDSEKARVAPTWASCLGVVAIVLGMLFTATLANEWMQQGVLAQFAPDSQVLPSARCPADELEEEEISLAECEYMVSRLEGLIQVTPTWFARTQTVLVSIGTCIAFASIMTGAALVNFKQWAPRAAAATFGLLAAIDVTGFIAALNTGPITREIYLWDALVWAAIHTMMLVGAVSGWRYEALRARGGVTGGARAPDRSDLRAASEANRIYHPSAVIFHWLIAVSIFFLFVSSWWMLALPLPSQVLRFREFPFQLHKNIGITIVLLLLALLYIRTRYRSIRDDASAVLSPVMRKLAIVDHVVLYGLILATCVSGYLSSSYSGWGTTFWWVLELPNWGHEDEQLNMLYSDIHLWSCWGLLAFVAVHIAGAVYHAFRNDGVVRRMLRLW